MKKIKEATTEPFENALTWKTQVAVNITQLYRKEDEFSKTLHKPVLLQWSLVAGSALAPLGSTVY